MANRLEALLPEGFDAVSDIRTSHTAPLAWEGLWRARRHDTHTEHNTHTHIGIQGNMYFTVAAHLLPPQDQARDVEVYAILRYHKITERPGLSGVVCVFVLTC